MLVPLVAAVAGEDVEERLGDDVRAAWERLFDELIHEVAPLEGAHELIVTLKERGHAVVMASSSIQKHFERFTVEQRGDDRRHAVGVEAARRAGVETITVITGGFSRQELLEAGAVAVFESLVELRERIDETPLR